MQATTKDQPSIEKAAKVEEAVSRAIELVRVFSERDPHDGESNNPWKDPQNMLDQLDRAREDIIKASEQPNNAPEVTSPIDENDFRTCYMDMVTNAFADVLEDMRNNNSDEELDVDVLVDCLQSGMDFLSGEEQEFLMMDDDEYEQLDDGLATPHEERQRQLGLQSVH